MSIVAIDDILFNDDSEERTIRYNNCIIFLILNGMSIFFGLFYLYIYFMIPKYNNNSNTLAFFFSIFHLISNFFYFIIFFELYLYEPIIISVTTKIITMFNPLIILCIYYWSACLTHNLYGTYYNFTHNIVKRFNFYKYLLFIIIIVFYLYTLLNINYNDSKIISKNFSFISNYNPSYIKFFYLCGLFIILFILYKLYFVINKKRDFIINEYQETKEKSLHLKNIFSSLISRNVAYICYFLLTFIPANTVMILKFICDEKKIKSYFIDFFVMILLSFFGSFIFLVKLFDPLLRNFIINLLLFNREFINNFGVNNRNSLTNVPLLLDNPENNLRNKNKPKTAIFGNNINLKKSLNHRNSFSPQRTKRKSEDKASVYVSKLSKPIQELSFSSEPNLNNIKNNSNRLVEMKNLEYFGKGNNSNNNLKRFESNFANELFLNINQEDNITEKDNYDKYNLKNNKNTFEEQKTNSINSNQNNYSFGNEDMFNKNPSKNSIINNERNNTIYLIKSLHQNKIKNSFTKTPTTTIEKSKFYNNKSFHNKNKSNTRYKSNLNIRSNSIKSNLLKRKIMHLGHPLPRRSISKVKLDLYHEEISSFASINYHLEVNENLLRMIAISISVNECRIYDDLDVYKKYYRSTIPWENKNFYTEKTKFKEYKDETIPNWLGIKNNPRFTNIKFKIMSYCPFVFHHIRLMDKISIDDLLVSLDPNKNILKLKEMKVLGGRGNNSLFRSWDKKIIIKTIDTNEKNIFFEKMIIDFHCLMRESRSILSRIYGLYKIDLIDKGSIYVIVQRNMDDLPLDTKLLTFDFKGSTVDRQIILKSDLGLIREKLWAKYKNKVLKDIDLDIIGIKFILEYENWKNIISIIDADSSFLQNLGVTDYSLVVFVHKYRKEDLEINRGCTRVIESKDRKYIFNFSIVDFLGTYNFMKYGEKWTKKFLGYIKKAKDTNYSALDPDNYGIRFRNFIKKIIKDE